MKCPNCNEEVEENDKFCSNCGTKLSLSNKPDFNEFNYRSNFEFEELKSLDDITNLKISLANIEFIVPLLILTLKNIIRENEYGELEQEDLYKQFIFSFITLFMTTTSINKSLKDRIYRNVEIDEDVFERIEYFIPTKRNFLTGSINLLEDMAILIILLKKIEDTLNTTLLKDNYKKAINEVLMSFINSDFEDKEVCEKIAKKYENRKYYDGILLLIKFLAKNGEVITNLKE